MKIFSCSQDLWDIVEEGFISPTNTSSLTTTQKKELKENKQKDSQKVLYILQQAVDNANFPRIMDSTNTKDAWSTLQEEFQGNDKVRAIKLQSLRTLKTIILG